MEVVKKFVVSFDNGSGVREWHSPAQDSPKEAWVAADLQPGQQLFVGSDDQLEEVVYDVVYEGGDDDA